VPVKLCTARRCPEVATYRGRCAEHARQVNRATHQNRSIYNSKRWQVLRRRVLFEQPLCACGEIAVDVDHITPLEQGGAPYERANCRGMCKRCHGEKTRKEQAWPATP
jgi:5-methylcytosine-specific restriction endonuclease McrA